jgi:ABC-type phosphate transport system substrate-binding protein
MRTILSSFLVFSLLFAVGCGKDSQDQSREGLRGTITVSGAWALYPMVVR